MEKVETYISQMLELVAAELNVKQVILKNGKHSCVYNYDTLHGKTISLENMETGAPYFTGDVITDMQKVRDLCSMGLKQRSSAGIPVRQPLQSITVNI